MNINVNQALNLLYIHFRETDQDLGLTESEIVDLTLLVVSRFGELTSPYVEHMIPTTKVQLVDVLRSPSGSGGLFHPAH